jgi:hypothetical protein
VAGGDGALEKAREVVGEIAVHAGIAGLGL